MKSEIKILEKHEQVKELLSGIDRYDKTERKYGSMRTTESYLRGWIDCITWLLERE